MGRRVLQGIRILEFGQFYVGPYVGEILAYLGAEVIKVESIKRPDTYRLAGSEGQPRFACSPLPNPWALKSLRAFARKNCPFDLL